MRVCFVEFFKTPLDAKFTNVYDSYNDMQEYFDFLEGNFDYKRVLEDYTDRSIIEMDNGARIVLPYEYSDVRDYNYLLISNNANVYDDEWNSPTTKWSYWFVVAGRSLNDSYGTGKSPACELTIVPDCFTNNELGVNTARKTYANIIKRHLDNSKIDESEVYDRIPNGFTIKKDIPLHELSVISTRVIWLRVRLTYDVYPIYYNDQSPASKFNATAVPSQPGSYITYVPYAVYDSTTNKINYVQSVYIKNLSPSYTASASIDLTSQYILDVEVAYLTPFYYTFSFNNSELTVNIMSNVEVIEYKTGSGAGASTIGIGCAYVSAPRYYSVKLTQGEILPALNKDSLVKVNNMKREFGLHTYPYKYSYVQIGQAKIPLIYTKNTEFFILEFDVFDRTNIRYRIAPSYNTTGGKINANIPYQYTSVSFPMIFSVDSLTAYKQTSNTSKVMASALKVLGGAVAILTAPTGAGIAAGTLALGSGLLTPSVSRLEADKVADETYLPNEIGSNEIEYLDYPKIVSCEIEEDYDKELLYNELHRYGYDFGENDIIENNYKDYFDYIIVNEIHLQYLTNSYDRMQIEDAYKRGITRWHLKSTNSSTILASMNYNVANFDISML